MGRPSGTDGSTKSSGMPWCWFLFDDSRPIRESLGVKLWSVQAIRSWILTILPERGASRKQIRDSNSSQDLTVDDQLDLLGGIEHLATSIAHRIQGARGLGVDLELASNQVDNPVARNSADGIGEKFLAPVVGQRRLGNLNNECDTSRVGLNGIVATDL